jgi:hypothetical protein
MNCGRPLDIADGLAHVASRFPDDLARCCGIHLLSIAKPAINSVQHAHAPAGGAVSFVSEIGASTLQVR